MDEQHREGVPHDPEGRLRTRRQQQPQEPVDPLLGELLAVDLGVDEVAQQIAAVVLTPVGDQWFEVLAHRA